MATASPQRALYAQEAAFAMRTNKTIGRTLSIGEQCIIRTKNLVAITNDRVFCFKPG